MSAANPFVGEIFMFAGNFAPMGWAFCDGQLLSISQNPVLFALLGTTYGGDGQATFALPDLRGRVPVHLGTSPSSGASYVQGQIGGVETVALQTGQLPPHRHAANANGGGNVVSPANAVWSTDPFGNTAAYTDPSDGTTMRGDAIGATSAAQAHDNMQPFLGVNFIISLFGIFPARN
jgi:microcystin-dependent protein